MEIDIDKIRAAMSAVVKRNHPHDLAMRESSGGFGYIWDVEFYGPYPTGQAHVSLSSTYDDMIQLVTAGITMKQKGIKPSATGETAIAVCDLAFRMGPAIPAFGVTTGGMFEIRYRFIPNGLTQEQLEYQIEAGLWCSVSQYCPMVNILADISQVGETLREFLAFMRAKGKQEKPSENDIVEMMKRTLGKKPRPNFG